MAAVLTGAGCGDDDDGDHVASRDEYIDALMGDSELFEEDDRCMAESFLDTYGLDALAEAGVTPDDIEANEPSELGLDLSDAQADAFYGRLVECMDVRGMFVDAMAHGGALAAEETACIEANMTDDVMKQLLVMFIRGGDDIEDNPELMDAVMPCLAPDTSGA